MFSSSFLVSAYVGLCWVDQVCEDDFYFWYCVEGVVICHKGTDALADITYLDADIPQESTACPTSHDHDCFWVQLAR